MAYNTKHLKSIKTASKQLKDKPSSTVVPESEKNISEMMLDPAYLRQSSALINEALQGGFDVLQLPNGDIIMTGTKLLCINIVGIKKPANSLKLLLKKSPLQKKSSFSLFLKKLRSQSASFFMSIFWKKESGWSYLKV
jgi:hypothetical protein